VASRGMKVLYGKSILENIRRCLQVMADGRFDSDVYTAYNTAIFGTTLKDNI
jgi:hypothetical protein